MTVMQLCRHQDLMLKWMIWKKCFWRCRCEYSKQKYCDLFGKSHNIIRRKIKKMLLVVFAWKKQIIKIPKKETKRDEPTDITFQEIQEWEKCSNIKGSKLFKERKIPGFISKGMADISTYVNKNKNR